MKAFVEFVVKALVDHPEQVDIKEVDGERTVVFELRLNQSDIGKVIGKSGRTITAIRSLLTSAAAKQGKRAMLEIIEPEGSSRTEGAAPAPPPPPPPEETPDGPAEDPAE
jgi:predicted RNA-binding protein YlqC (UPF0109 family)